MGYYSPVHFANFFIFVFVLGTVSSVAPHKVDLDSIKSYQNYDKSYQKPGKSDQNHDKSYQNHHNACTRKLMCLIASQKNGYGNIIQGKNHYLNRLNFCD